MAALSGRRTPGIGAGVLSSPILSTLSLQRCCMPIILWLLGVPFSLILILWLFGVVHF